jgi:hypothetical protein
VEASVEEGAVRSATLCSSVSSETREPLAATASRVDHWLLVEYRGVWSRETLAESGLSPEVKNHLRAQLAALPRSRLLFVRRPERRGRAGYAVFLARSLERDRRLHGLEVERYDDLREVDFAAALAGGPPVGEPVRHPLFVVCTHGKRDRCCAKFGRPLYEELCEQAEPEWVWQATHVGGDRFAGNVVALPDGLYFGRVDRTDVWSLLDELLAGRVDLAHYRGRSCYGFAVQAAEHRIRVETGTTAVDDLRLEGLDRSGDSTWSVRFRVAPAGDLHEVDVAALQADEPLYLTCSSLTLERPRRHVATGHRILRS